MSVTMRDLGLRKMIECGFLPLSCLCTQNPDGSLTIKITEPSSGSVELLVAGVSTASLTTSSAVAILIAELRSEMKDRQNSFNSKNCSEL
ncbi:DUF1652 domain-containing protein [Pseudomonas rhodesiae]|uniref:DUF1652 domain-containing protein n=1 Tax=Pseudomonas rhodesiae TaxID=76760 RepID=UPI0032B1C01E